MDVVSPQNKILHVGRVASSAVAVQRPFQAVRPFWWTTHAKGPLNPTAIMPKTLTIVDTRQAVRV